MSEYGAALTAMMRAAEALADAAEEVRRIPRPHEIPDVGMLERVARRTENAAAQVELDRRIVDSVRVRQITG